MYLPDPDGVAQIPAGTGEPVDYNGPSRTVSSPVCTGRFQLSDPIRS
jgi:hypothetical protein